MCTFMCVYFPNHSIRCKLSAGNDPADAVLVDDTGAVFKQIQVTFAVDGRTEHLRSRELNKAGQVDGLGKPVESGRGRNRTVIFPATDMTLHHDHVNEVLSLVRTRIESKSSMAYGTGFSLVVGFSDRSLDSKDVDAFMTLKAQVPHTFSEIYLVGIHGIILVPARSVQKASPT